MHAWFRRDKKREYRVQHCVVAKERHPKTGADHLHVAFTTGGSDYRFRWASLKDWLEKEYNWKTNWGTPQQF